MPSLHIAQELVMLWAARHSRWFFAMSFVFTAITMVAVVVLGWHYPIDALGGALLAAIAILIVRRFDGRLFPKVFEQAEPVHQAPSED